MAGAIGLTLSAALLQGCTFEQLLIGQWYAIQTPAFGACPLLVWRFVVDANRAMTGFLSRNGQQRIANLSGQLAEDDNFRITVMELAGPRTATVVGRFTSEVSTLSIQGDAAGRGCDGRTFSLRLGSYFAFQGGGGGGGN
jgi:hypothetical protein